MMAFYWHFSSIIVKVNFLYAIQAAIFLKGIRWRQHHTRYGTEKAKSVY